MDKELKELLEYCIEERSQSLYSQMCQSAPQIDERVKGVAALSEEVEHCTGIDKEAKNLVQRFMFESAEVDSEFQKFLYIQGVKDCVAILKELGVIK